VQAKVELTVATNSSTVVTKDNSTYLTLLIISPPLDNFSNNTLSENYNFLGLSFFFLGNKLITCTTSPPTTIIPTILLILIITINV